MDELPKSFFGDHTVGVIMRIKISQRYSVCIAKNVNMFLKVNISQIVGRAVFVLYAQVSRGRFSRHVIRG